MSGRGGAYLLTWTTYASWLPGDERGFVSRIPDGRGGWMIRNEVGTEYAANMPNLERRAAQRSGDTVLLDLTHAIVCADAFRETAAKHGLTIEVGAIMRTHVHLVVRSAEREGASLLNLFKGASSRRLGQAFGAKETGWWTRHGSRRVLTTARSFSAAVEYVRNQQSPLLLFSGREEEESAT